MQITEMLGQIKEYQAKLGYDYTYGSSEARMTHIRELTLALIVEATEFLEWNPWKPWRSLESQTTNVKEAALELIDVFFFTANLWAATGHSPEEFESLFKWKLEENLSRINRGYNLKPIEQLELRDGDTGETL